MSWKAVFLTLFPEMYPGALGLSVTGRALGSAWTCMSVNIRDYAPGKHRRTDDTPYGGGAGMVMCPEAVGNALEATWDERLPLYCLSPKGARFDQHMARHMANGPGALFLCPRFEGPDQRILEYYPFQEVSIGDFIMTNGDIAAQCMCDAAVRLLPEVLGNQDTLCEESFGGANFSGLLEYPLYTKPLTWKGIPVPDTLLSGNHARIYAWRRHKAEQVTRERRPDLWEKYKTESLSVDLSKTPGKHQK